MKVMQGTVVSAKTAKTATVVVTRQWQHPVYKKYVKRTKKYACHIDKIEVKEGDIVTITECKPISKTKNFVITAKSESTKPVLVKEDTKVRAEKKVVKAEPEVKDEVKEVKPKAEKVAKAKKTK
jgi:small subunit ribosomal protein S17